jgi:hypothetical protein
MLSKLDLIPKNIVVYVTFGVYAIALANAEHVWFFLSGMALSAALVYLAMTPEERRNKDELKSVIRTGAVFYVIAFAGAIYVYQKDRAHRQFQNYLSEHSCKHVRTVVTNFVPEQCDNLGRCADEHEVTEDEYFCRTTRRTITFKQFSEGNYGY